MYDIGSIIVVKEQSAVVIEAVKLTLSPWAAWIVRRQQIADMRIVGGEQHIPGAPMVTQ